MTAPYILITEVLWTRLLNSSIPDFRFSQNLIEFIVQVVIPSLLQLEVEHCLVCNRREFQRRFYVI